MVAAKIISCKDKSRGQNQEWLFFMNKGQFSLLADGKQKM
jgi:hypothetical protein